MLCKILDDDHKVIPSIIKNRRSDYTIKMERRKLFMY